MKNFPLLVLIVSFALFSCEDTKQNYNCLTVKCSYAPHLLKIKYVDKDSNEDLIFNEKPKYPIDDFEIASSDSQIKLDSTFNQSLIVAFWYSDFSIKLGDLPSDTVKISTRNIINTSPKSASDCCRRDFEITEIKANNTILCKSCLPGDTLSLTLSK